MLRGESIFYKLMYKIFEGYIYAFQHVSDTEITSFTKKLWL